MKILIINYFFPPVGGAHSYRWQQISHEWGRQGHEVTVVTSRSIDRGVVSRGLDLIEVGSPVSKNRFQKNTSHHIGFKRVMVDQLKKYIYRKLYWPDGLWYWLPQLLMQLFKMRTIKYDLVVSYSPTFGSHLGGLFFKSINKSGFKWIADYGDPFSLSSTMPPNNLFLFNRLNHYFEKRVLKASDVAVFTNEETLDAYQKSFEDVAYKYIPHAVDIDIFYEAKKACEPTNKTIRLCYVGGFHKGIREPYHAIETMKRVIAEAEKESISIIFEIYGPNNGIDIESLATDSIHYHGPIDRESAIQRMKGADFLLNIENINCLMTPSKIVEYVATGLPIINFYSQNISRLMTAAAEANNCLNVGLEDNPRKLLRFIKSRRNMQLSGEEVSDLLNSYKIQVISEMYLKNV